MKSFVRRFVFALVVALLGASTPAWAEERPFHLQGAGQLQLGEDASGTFSASGKATHLGKWTNTGTIRFVLAAPGILEATGEVIFTTVNGDELRARFEGQLAPATGIGIAVFAFDGGTGRFANASGVTDAVILQDPDGSFTFTLDGTIDY